MPDEHFSFTPTQLADYLDHARPAMVLAERERCAKIAEEKSALLPHQSDFDRGYACGRSGAAAAIRNLKD